MRAGIIDDGLSEDALLVLQKNEFWDALRDVCSNYQPTQAQLNRLRRASVALDILKFDKLPEWSQKALKRGVD